MIERHKRGKFSDHRLLYDFHDYAIEELSQIKAVALQEQLRIINELTTLASDDTQDSYSMSYAMKLAIKIVQNGN